MFSGLIIPARFRGILSVVGCTMVAMSAGAVVWSKANVLSYVFAYLVIVEKSGVSMGSLGWVGALDAVGYGLSGFVIWRIDARIGTRATLAVASILITISYLVSYWTVASAAGIFATLGLIQGVGLATASSALAVLAKEWYPQRIGMVSGLVASGSCLAGAGINAAMPAYINPQNVPPEIFGKDVIITDEFVLKRVPSFFLILGGFSACVQLFGFLLISRNPDSQYNELVEAESVADEMKAGPMLVVLWFTNLFRSPALFYIMTYSKLFGLKVTSEDMISSLANTAGAILTLIAKPAIGAVADRVGYGPAMSSVSTLASVTFGTFWLCQMSKSAFLYVVWTAIVIANCGTSPPLFNVALRKLKPEKFMRNTGIVNSAEIVTFGLYLLATSLGFDEMHFSGLLLSIAAFQGVAVVCTVIFDCYDMGFVK